MLLLLLAISPARASAPQNVILISVDTLRADRLGCYGYLANKTPNIDRWASEGILFRKAFSEYPLTLPAHSTLLTGTSPLHHGVRENLGFNLGEEHLTLAEILKGEGFATAGFVGSYVLAREFGLAQGFDYYDDNFDTQVEDMVSATAIQRSAEEVTSRLVAWLTRHQGLKFFAFVHYFDPHTPRPRGYDSEVSEVDRSIGKLHEFLKENRLLEKTLVVFTADHGESLGEHGESGHGFFIYDSSLHIPLIIRGAGEVGNLIPTDVPVSLADVVPTILARLGLEVPAEVQGLNLLAPHAHATASTRSIYAETSVPQIHFGWSRLRSIRDERYKYIAAPDPELYDLRSDPLEHFNLALAQPRLEDQYRTRLREFLRGYAEPLNEERAEDVQAETARRLAALGYVRPSSRAKSQSNIDPKKRIAAFERYHQALNQLAEGRASRQTLKTLDYLQKEAPEMRGTAFLRAWVHETLGETDKAIENFRIALSQDRQNHPARARYAQLLIRQGELAAAEEELSVILELAPDDYKSRNNLAGLYHLTGRSELAVKELIRITDERPSYSAAWQNLGRVQLDLHAFPAAERSFRRLIELKPGNAAAYILLSRSLRGQGRIEEAARETQRAKEISGINPPPE